MEVTPIARDRGRAISVAVALAISASLVAAPASFGANDPVATGTFTLKLTKGFKKMLKRNGVRMKPKSPNFRSGSLDPITGAGSLRLKKITFRKGGKKYVYGNVRATLGANGAKGNIRGNKGKLFQLKGGKVEREAFGARVSGVRAKFLKGAAKKINRKLDLGSLKARKAGRVTFAEQPETVEVLGGTAFVDVPLSYLPASVAVPGTGGDPNTVLAKGPAHCISPAVGSAAIAPAAKATFNTPNPEVGPVPTGIAARFKFPVTGGTVGPSGNAGVLQLAGGVRLQTGGPDGVPGWGQGTDCPAQPPGEATSNSYLNTTNLAPNLEQRNVQSNAFLGGLLPGCLSAGNPPDCPIFAGDRGVVIGQVLDFSGATVAADPTAKTVQISGVGINNNPTSTLTLNGLFPDGNDPDTTPFVDGDKFGIAILTVNTR